MKNHRLLAVLVVLFVTPRLAMAVDVVVLTTGEVLRGEILEHTAEHLVMHHPVLGELTINAADIESFTMHLDEEAAAEVAAPAEPQPEPPPAPVEEPKKQKQWKSHFDLGVSGTAGNTEDANLRLAIKSVWTRPENILTFDAGFNYATSNGDETENNFTAGVLSDWPMAESPWGYFAQGRYDHDNFDSWTDRLSAGAGVSYRLFDIDEPIPGTDERRVFQVRLRGGFGFAREWGSMNTDFQPEAILGANLVWKLNSRQDLLAGTTLYPNLGDFGEFRVVSNIEWILKIDQLDGINFKLGAAHEYQSRTDGPIKHSDLSVYAALGIDF